MADSVAVPSDGLLLRHSRRLMHANNACARHAARPGRCSQAKQLLISPDSILLLLQHIMSTRSDPFVAVKREVSFDFYFDQFDTSRLTLFSQSGLQ